MYNITYSKSGESATSKSQWKLSSSKIVSSEDLSTTRIIPEGLLHFNLRLRSYHLDISTHRLFIIGLNIASHIISSNSPTTTIIKTGGISSKLSHSFFLKITTNSSTYYLH